MIKTYNQSALGLPQTNLDKTFNIFAIAHFLSASLEILLDCYLFKKKEFSVTSVIFCKWASMIKSIIIAAMIGAAFTGGISYGIVQEFGFRQCRYGQYMDGSSCVRCSMTLGENCLACTNSEICTNCSPNYYFSPTSKSCISC